jgi:hypothetical protein
MLERTRKLMDRLSQLLTGVGTAIDEDLEEACKDAAKPPPGCQTLTLTADQLNHLLALQARQVAPGCQVKKVHYVMEPGQGLKAHIYYKKAGDG